MKQTSVVRTQIIAPTVEIKQSAIRPSASDPLHRDFDTATVTAPNKSPLKSVIAEDIEISPR